MIRRRDRLTVASFLLPAILATLVVVAFPLAYTLYNSFTNWVITNPAPPEFVGLRNYLDLPSDPRVLQALVRTLLFTVAAVAIQMVLGVAMALVMNHYFFGRSLIRTLALFPVVATPVAVSLIFVTMMNPQTGVLNYFLNNLNIPPLQWIYGENSVIPSLILVDTWQWTPFVMLIALAGLATLPSEPFESARIDGASSWQTFWKITLPMLMPTLFVAMLFRAIDTIKLFDTIFAMTQGGPAPRQ
jgi:multiple sugar transport system permease protein